MNTAQWHVDPADLAAYGDGWLTGVGADSTEAHLLRCATCRSVLAARSTTTDRDRRWDLIAAEIDRPTPMARAASWLRLAVGTPELMVSALALLVGLLAVPVVLSISNPRAGIAWFLAVAPAVPVAGAVLAYRVASDPAGEIAVASPMHTFRIVVMRTSVVLAAALPIGLLTSVLLPLPTSRLLGWLLPGLALCAVVLAAGTRFDPAKVGAALVIGWAGFVMTGFYRQRRVPIADALRDVAVNRPALQATFAVITVLAAVVFLARRDDVAYSRAS